MSYLAMSTRRHLLNLWSQAAIRVYKPVHRGYAGRFHRARWLRAGEAEIARQWLMEARICSVCGETRTRAMGWQR